MTRAVLPFFLLLPLRSWKITTTTITTSSSSSSSSPLLPPSLPPLPFLPLLFAEGRGGVAQQEQSLERGRACWSRNESEEAPVFWTQAVEAGSRQGCPLLEATAPVKGRRSCS